MIIEHIDSLNKINLSPKSRKFEVKTCQKNKCHLIRESGRGAAGREHNFDCKIFLKRIAREEEYKRATTTEGFRDSAALNGNLWDDAWLDLEAIKKQYPIIDDEIISRLVFRHYKHVGKDAAKKVVYITDDDEPLPGKMQMETGCYTLIVRYKGLKMIKGEKVEKGDTWMEDISCDSDYMIDVMPRVGEVSCCIVRCSAESMLLGCPAD